MQKLGEKEEALVSKGNEIVEPAECATSAEALISQAIQKNVPVETMERLLAMRRELKAEYAKEEYDKAMSAFQAECPIIEKTKVVMNKDGRTVRYKFAPIESIVKQVQPFLKKHGFSYSINAKVNGGITIVCKVTHEAGHSEISEFSVPIEKDAYMNEQQKVASASTFAKRYAFCNAFGILTGDEDDDSQTSGQPQAPQQPQRQANTSQPQQKTWIKDPLSPASDKQKWMINKLLDDTQTSRDWLIKVLAKYKLTFDTMQKGVASQLIEQLQAKANKMGREMQDEKPSEYPTIDAETGEYRDAEVHEVDTNYKRQ